MHPLPHYFIITLVFTATYAGLMRLFMRKWPGWRMSLLTAAVFLVTLTLFNHAGFDHLLSQVLGR